MVRWRSVSVAPYPHDLAAARRELAAAGNPPLEGTIGARADDPTNVRIATLVQSQLAAAGFQLALKPQPTRLWYSFTGLLRDGKAAVVGETWIGGSDPEQSVNLRCATATEGGDNHSFYCSRELDTLFDDQMRARSERQRRHDFDEMQVLVHRDVPVIPLYYEVLLEGVNKRVTGYAKNMLRFPVGAENWDAR